MANIKIEIDSKSTKNGIYQGKINVEFEADEKTTDLIVALVKKECLLLK